MNRKKVRKSAVVMSRPTKTVIVLGSGRGGTSAVAGAVHLLGIRMMEDEALNSEDSEIVRAFQDNMSRGHAAASIAVSKVILERNSKNDVWGWKDPSSDLYLESVVNYLRNPHFIFVIRNVFDVASNHVTTNSINIQDSVDLVMTRYARYWSLIRKLDFPTLLVGYERMLLDKRNFVNEVCSFLSISPGRKKIGDVLSFIDSSGGYRLPKSRK